DGERPRGKGTGRPNRDGGDGRRHGRSGGASRLVPRGDGPALSAAPASARGQGARPTAAPERHPRTGGTSLRPQVTRNSNELPPLAGVARVTGDRAVVGGLP